MRKLLVLGVLIAAVALMAGCGGEESGQAESTSTTGGRAALSPAEGGKMAVKVNGTTITEAEVAEEEGRLTMAMGGRMDPQQLESMKPMIREQATNNLINRTLLAEAVKEEGIEVTSEEVDTRMADLEMAAGGTEAFDNRLSMMGVSRDELREEIELGVKIERLMEERAGDSGEPTEIEIKTFYDENPAQFEKPEQVHASHILFMVEEGATDEARTEKRKEAEEVLAQIRSGGDFAALATAHSDCPSSSKGGDLGYFSRGQMVPPFEEAAFAMEPGEVSDIVETRFGYHIIKVVDKAKAEKVPYDEAKSNIKQYLGGQDKQQAMTNVIEDLRANATIEYPEP
ncbi:MAG: peptidylprolyl isomerase [bacterium]|jgi:peptidyl-prolyl cis-trans isomerase C